MRYSIKNPWVLWGLTLMVAPSLLMMSSYWTELTQVQECLALGKGFDYHSGTCIKGATQFVPFSVRQPLLVNGGILLSMLGLLFCLIGLFKRKQ